MNSVIQMKALAGIRAECRVTDFTLCHGQSSRALQRQSRRWLLGHPGRWLHHAWLHASWNVGRCDAAACWLSCISHQPWICPQRGSGEERSHLLCNCTFVVISAPWESASSEWAVTAAQGLGSWWPQIFLPSFLPWCFLNVCQEHHSRQTHMSAPWSLSGRQLPVYFYCFACLQSLDFLTQVKKTPQTLLAGRSGRTGDTERGAAIKRTCGEQSISRQCPPTSGLFHQP